MISGIQDAAPLSAAESSAFGKAKRTDTPRQAHASWVAAPDRPSPISLLKEQEQSRLPELIPLRYERMGVSPFTFFRGGALTMAADLANTPNTGLRVQACGDAHIANFGGFASPERRLVFDINDFDETLPGPWEWDVKRLATSVEICGRDRNFTARERRAAVLETVKSYREAMAEFAEMKNLEVWYAHLDVEEQLQHIAETVSKQEAKSVRKELVKAHSKTSASAVKKLTEVVDGKLQIISTPPLVVPLTELMPENERLELEASIKELLETYAKSLQRDRKHLIEQYAPIDIARKVVGVGSVGTRAWIMVLAGRDETDSLVLQIKEAQPSVLERFVGGSGFGHHGQRVVEGQRLMQASSDTMLGWARSKGIDGIERDFYVRQLWDWKTSPDLDKIDLESLMATAQMCGWTLARAHARSGNRVAIAAYLGASDIFDKAVADFACAYAEQNQTDYDEFKAALEAGVL